LGLRKIKTLFAQQPVMLFSQQKCLQQIRPEVCSKMFSIRLFKSTRQPYETWSCKKNVYVGKIILKVAQLFDKNKFHIRKLGNRHSEYCN